jgi:multiple sugar transport system permease protein
MRLTRAQVGFLFFLPSLLAILLFIFKPLADSIFMSLRKIDLLFSAEEFFVGLENYVWLIKSDWFFGVLLRTIIFTFGIMSTQILLALCLALLTDFEYPGKKVIRSILIAPWAIPLFVAAMTWSWLYSPGFGPINHLLLELGILNESIDLLGNKQTALVSAMVAMVWKGLPFVYLVMLAGLQQIPHELREAARVSGANTWQEFLYVTLPGLRYIVTMLILLRTIWLFNHFAFVFVLTRGGPLGATETLAISAIRMGIDSFRYGRAAAITTTMFFVLLVLFFIYWRLDKEQRRIT